MKVKRFVIGRGIEEYDDPNCITKEESDARIAQEKAAKDTKETHRKELVKHLQNIVDGKEILDQARLAQAVLLALGEDVKNDLEKIARPQGEA